MTLRIQVIAGIGLFAAGFLFCAVLGLTKAESYRIQIEQLGLVIQAVNRGPQR